MVGSCLQNLRRKCNKKNQNLKTKIEKETSKSLGTISKRGKIPEGYIIVQSKRYSVNTKTSLINPNTLSTTKERVTDNNSSIDYNALSTTKQDHLSNNNKRYHSHQVAINQIDFF